MEEDMDTVDETKANEPNLPATRSTPYPGDTATVDETMVREPTMVAPREESGLARYFGLAKYNVTFGSEVMAGITTFLVMAYIAFVNPIILTTLPDSAGFKLDFNKTVTATCWVACIMCLAMGLYARRPFAMASGLGLNAFV